MDISVFNQSRGALTDEEVQTVVRAINHQLYGDFATYWSTSASMRVGADWGPDDCAHPAADAVIYLRDELDVSGTLDYHARHHQTAPWAVIFVGSTALRDSWTVALSHAALELVGDPRGALLASGPHPTEKEREVFYWYEMCDAVQAESYLIEGVEVSNFLLPGYFVEGDGGGRTDFLGVRHDGEMLAPFGVHPGGYVGFFDPQTGTSAMHLLPGDSAAAGRLLSQRKLGAASREARRERIGAGLSLSEAATNRHSADETDLE